MSLQKNKVKLGNRSICICIVYQRNKVQTVEYHVCFYVFAIIKELGKYIYTFQQKFNKNRSTHLSFYNMLVELTKIKIVEFKIGNDATRLKILRLSETQKRFFEILNLTSSQMLLVCE